MDIYKLPLFREMQREYKRSFDIDITSFIKPNKIIIDFKGFASKYLTSNQHDVLNSIEKHRETNIILSDDIASGKTFLACYLYLKTLIKNRHLYKEDTNNFILGNSQK
nr:hypothetical protein [Borrelia puertoricensis]